MYFPRLCQPVLLFNSWHLFKYLGQVQTVDYSNVWITWFLLSSKENSLYCTFFCISVAQLIHGTPWTICSVEMENYRWPNPRHWEYKDKWDMIHERICGSTAHGLHNNMHCCTPDSYNYFWDLSSEFGRKQFFLGSFWEWCWFINLRPFFTSNRRQVTGYYK